MLRRIKMIFWRLKEHAHSSPQERAWDARQRRDEGPAVGGAYSGGTFGSALAMELAHTTSVNFYTCEKCGLGYTRMA